MLSPGLPYLNSYVVGLAKTRKNRSNYNGEVDLMIKTKYYAFRVGFHCADWIRNIEFAEL